MRFFLQKISIFLFLVLSWNNILASTSGVSSIAPVLNKILPSVVNLSVAKKKSLDASEGMMLDPNMQKFFEEFGQHFGFRFKSPEQAEKTVYTLGSGVIIDAKNGYVVTNQHVVFNAEEISVTMNDNRVFNAKLLGHDKETDLAVIQIIDGSNLSECKIGDSSNIQVGDFVIAIGNPFGLSHTVTSGIISALERTIADSNSIGHLIQTDASINPGNSGGALINFDGELIGINVSIFSTSKTGGNIGIGFAIPSNLVKIVSDQLIKKGKFERGRLGIEVQTVTSDMIDAMDLPKNFITGGSIITKVENNSPASKAGLQTGDIIISVDGNLIKDNFSLINLIAPKSKGEKASIKLLRNKKIQEVTVQIVKFSPGVDKISNEVQGIEQLKGVYFSNIDTSHKLYGKVEGIIISKIDSSSKLAKFEYINVGDIVLSVNQEKVKSVAELSPIMKKFAKKSVLLNVYNENGSSKFIVIK